MTSWWRQKPSITSTPLGWRAFEAFCRGELSMARVLKRRGIHAAVSLLAARADKAHDNSLPPVAR